MHVGFRNRLSYRQARNTVVVALILGVVFSVGQIFVDFLNEREHVRATVSQIVSMIREPAAQATYRLDEPLAENVLSGLFKYQPVRKAQIIDDFGTALASRERPPTTGWLQWLVDATFGRDLEYSEQLFSAGGKEPLGRIDVSIDSYLVALNFLTRAEVMIISGGVLVAALALVLTLMFYTSMTQPLLKMVRNLSSVDPALPADRLLQIPRGHKYDEMGLLGTTVNGLLEAFERSLSDRRGAEELLQENEARIRNIMDSVPDAIITANEAGLVENCNQTAVSLFGLETEQLLGRSLDQLFAQPFEVPWLEEGDSRHDKGISGDKGKAPQETTALHRDGSAVPVEIQSTEMQCKDQVLTVWVVRDISERVRAMEALRESEEKYRQLFEMESDPIFLIESDTGSILEVNSAALALYKYSRGKLLKMKNTDLSAEPEQTRKATLSLTATVPLRYHKNKNGTVFPVEITASHFTWRGKQVHVAAIRDISLRIETEKEREQLRAQLQQAQKMEAIGTLAGGIAHDFNNLLQAVQGYAELLLLDKKKSGSGYRELGEIVRAARRGSDLTQQLLTFSRKVESKLRPVDLNLKVRKTKNLLERTIAKMIEIELCLLEDLRVINADPTQIEQALMNLVLNAKDAMPEGGKLTIHTDNVLIDEEYSRKYPEIELGEYVRLTVSDTGTGIDKAILDHIFDPFFTTKERAESTGLGLAIVYGIVKSHGGYITCFSEVNAGTTFEIYFKASTQEMKPEQSVAEELLVGGSEAILLVDDEPYIRELGETTLEKFGYRVLTAIDGESALDIYREQRERIDLVILDLIMPRMGGNRCLDEILKLNPAAKVLVSSGYSDFGPLKETVDSGAKGFIAKPYEIMKMLKMVREVLDKD